jgi:uncharacterized membrane protein YsdA (DUF1294 family)
MPFVLACYALMSAVAFAMYRRDKQRAERGEWRISEAALHLVELLGGWPGAWLAQQVFQHKRRKTAYMAVFWAIVGIHAAGWSWWAGAFG